MKRRRNGEGSYTQDKNGLYVYSCRYDDPVSGEQKRKYLRANTKSALDAKVAEWNEQRNLRLSPEQITVGEWCTQFLAYVKPSIKAKTYNNYEGNIRLHINPALGKIRLNKLNLAQVQTMLNRLNDKGLSPVSVLTVRRVLCVVLNKAVEFSLIERNPARHSKAPRVEPKLPVVLSKEEAMRLLEYAEAGDFLPKTDDEGALYVRQCYYVAVRLALDSGCRQAELFALRWCDFKDGKLYISRALEGSRIGTPKTRTSYRAITLASSTIDILESWRVYQRSYCEKWQLWQATPQSLIFTTGWGTPVYVQNMSKRWWHPLLHASHMPAGTHWHSLRATMATLLLQAGVPVKVVSERLGHSNINVTLLRYNGIVHGIEEQSAVVMNDILTKSVEPYTVDVLPEEGGENND